MMLVNGTTLANDSAAELPSMEMLEFLGQWETANGEWIDPAMLEEIPAQQQGQKHGEQDEK